MVSFLSLPWNGREPVSISNCGRHRVGGTWSRGRHLAVGSPRRAPVCQPACSVPRQPRAGAPAPGTEAASNPARGERAPGHEGAGMAGGAARLPGGLPEDPGLPGEQAAQDSAVTLDGVRTGRGAACRWPPDDRLLLTAAQSHRAPGTPQAAPPPPTARGLRHRGQLLPSTGVTLAPMTGALQVVAWGGRVLAGQRGRPSTPMQGARPAASTTPFLKEKRLNPAEMSDSVTPQGGSASRPPRSSRSRGFAGWHRRAPVGIPHGASPPLRLVPQCLPVGVRASGRASRKRPDPPPEAQ